MNDLQQSAIRMISELAEELDNEIIRLGNKLNIDKEPFDASKHTYPLASKARDIKRWAEAVLQSNKK